MVASPHGIFLVTGPTGSGKTTTLYAAMGELNSDAINILTIENPIEYSIKGIGQTQVNEKADMTFARGLRAILRQDPDVVMVGEIRDLETAQTAVQASLTGHLVMSTVHTNTAIGAVTRLVDMGVEPFLIASSMVGVLAQRLVRTLCAACKVAVEPSPLEQRFWVACTRVLPSAGRKDATPVETRASGDAPVSTSWSRSTRRCAGSSTTRPPNRPWPSTRVVTRPASRTMDGARCWLV